MKGVKRPAPGEAESNGKKAAGRGKGHESVEKEEESEVEQEAVQDSKSRRGGGGKEADADDADVDAKNGSQDEEGKGGAPAGGEKDGAADSSQSKRPKEVRNTTRMRVCPPFFKYRSLSFLYTYCQHPQSFPPRGALEPKLGYVQQQQYEYHYKIRGMRHSQPVPDPQQGSGRSRCRVSLVSGVVLHHLTDNRQTSRIRSTYVNNRQVKSALFTYVHARRPLFVWNYAYCCCGCSTRCHLRVPRARNARPERLTADPCCARTCCCATTAVRRTWYVS